MKIDKGWVTEAGSQTMALSQAKDPAALIAKAGDSPDEIKKAATQFESLLMKQMMESMWNTISTKDTLLGSREEEMYRDMFNQALSDEIASGQGIGVKEVIERELTKSTQSTPHKMLSAKVGV